MTHAPRRIHALTALVLLAAAGCSFFLVSQKSDRLIFSHKLHIANDIACETCHASIAQSANTGTRDLPTMDTCSACHGEDVKSNCAKCHTRPDRPARVVQPDTHMKFSHVTHLPRTDNACTRCHKAITTSDTTANTILPNMDQCRSCHAKQFSSLQCATCHESLADYPVEPVLHASHKGNFLAEHGEFARTDQSTCAQCHPQSFCADCHSRVEGLTPGIKYPERLDRDFIHRGDWITAHRYDARADSTQCLKCHGASQCRDCHQTRGVAATPAGGASPHPDGWLIPGSGDSHGKAARRDPVTCAGCHDNGRETNCIACHRTGRNIHPPGWTSTLKKTDAVCRTCHQ